MEHRVVETGTAKRNADSPALEYLELVATLLRTPKGRAALARLVDEPLEVERM